MSILKNLTVASKAKTKTGNPDRYHITWKREEEKSFTEALIKGMKATPTWSSHNFDPMTMSQIEMKKFVVALVEAVVNSEKK